MAELMLKDKILFGRNYELEELVVLGFSPRGNVPLKNNLILKELSDEAVRYEKGNEIYLFIRNGDYLRAVSYYNLETGSQWVITK